MQFSICDVDLDVIVDVDDGNGDGSIPVAAPNVLYGGRALLIRVVGMLTRTCRA